MNETFMEFHINLMGYDVYRENGEWIPKYILYWGKLSSDRILLNKTKYKAVEK